MKRRNRKRFYIGIGLLAAFVIFTVSVRLVDVEAIGPNRSAVGFSTLNGFVHNLTGVHLSVYTLTDWLGLVPIAFAFGFAVFGLLQWLKRKSLMRVDFSILQLGAFYAAVVAVYIFFEFFAVNYRPVLINGHLEASYPSSTTVLVMCVMPTARMQFNMRIKSKALRCATTLAIVAFVAFMVSARLFSGVHWFTDIVGGALLSGGLVNMYAAVVGRELQTVNSVV